MTKPKLFVSHVTEEAPLAEILKAHLSRDFLGLVDIFVSSDMDSIAAGDNWLRRLEQALRESSALLVLCSYASINRPWVNFEVGAAWISSIPIVPICHSGLRPTGLPMPFNVLQAIEANSESGLKRAYVLVASKLSCNLPQKEFFPLISEVIRFEQGYAPRIRVLSETATRKQAAVRDRVYDALNDPEHKWRFVETLAALAGITDDEVVELLLQDPQVVLGKSKADGRRIARLKSREV
jgi:TIR domain